jgi:hypothetical protein
MDLTNAQWRKSSYSGNNGGQCVETRALPDIIAVRDSKNPDGGILTFSPEMFSAFLSGIKNGRFSGGEA